MSELVSSLAILIITIALLGGISAVAFGSVRSSGDLLSSNSQNQANESGLLLALVSVQSNSSGSYVWVYDYGWVQGKISATYLNGGTVQYATSCGGTLEPSNICAVSIAAGQHGEMSLVFGSKSLDVSV